ncbi:MAG: cytochrome c peroxidase [Flavitalea sp.]
MELGRMLFYEKSLSSTNKFSCSNCHDQKFAFTDRKVFSPGVDSEVNPRNTMSLANLLWVKNFFWDGRTEGLEKQVEVPLTGVHEMGQSLDASVAKVKKKKFYAARFEKAFGSREITANRIVKAIAQFERTLVSAGSRYDLHLQGKYRLNAEEQNGMDLFFTNPNPSKGVRGAGCASCHGGPKTYSELFQNNGLEKQPNDPDRQAITGLAIDEGRFRVVTLRNIALTAPYMHDGRFSSLEQVLDHYNEHVVQSEFLSPFIKNNSNIADGEKLGLTAIEKKNIIAFLGSLTDSTFISDPRFSDPFK